MTVCVILVVCGWFGWFLGVGSNGMTSPRKAFDIYSGPFAGIIGSVIGLVAALIVGVAILPNLLLGLLLGAAAGWSGLGLARLKRRFGNWQWRNKR